MDWVPAVIGAISAYQQDRLTTSAQQQLAQYRPGNAIPINAADFATARWLHLGQDSTRTCAYCRSTVTALTNCRNCGAPPK